MRSSFNLFSKVTEDADMYAFNKELIKLFEETFEKTKREENAISVVTMRITNSKLNDEQLLALTGNLLSPMWPKADQINIKIIEKIIIYSRVVGNDLSRTLLISAATHSNLPAMKIIFKKENKHLILEGIELKDITEALEGLKKAKEDHEAKLKRGAAVLVYFSEWLKNKPEIEQLLESHRQTLLNKSGKKDSISDAAPQPSAAAASTDLKQHIAFKGFVGASSSQSFFKVTEHTNMYDFNKHLIKTYEQSGKVEVAKCITDAKLTPEQLLSLTDCLFSTMWPKADPINIKIFENIIINMRLVGNNLYGTLLKKAAAHSNLPAIKIILKNGTPQDLEPNDITEALEKLENAKKDHEAKLKRGAAVSYLSDWLLDKPEIDRLLKSHMEKLKENREKEFTSDSTPTAVSTNPMLPKF